MRGHISNATDPTIAGVERQRSSRSADRAYQTLTIAAILIILGSLWVF
jgi:hypothetical protein